MKRWSFGVILALAVGAGASADSPYAGQESRDVKALSADDIDDLLNGRGMGFAKAAELNRHPGPRHVLDLADELELTKGQRRQTEEIFASMQASAKSLGVRVVALEHELDRRFAEEDVDAGALEALLSRLGTLYGELRYVHLAAHVAQKSLLSHHQLRLYDRLRGYGVGAGEEHGHVH